MTDHKSARKPLPSQERLHELFRYEPETGKLTRIAKSGRRGVIGEVVGSRGAKGYLYVSIDGLRYLVHRIVYKMMTSEDPPAGRDIDHLNGDRGDNRWNNLRVVSRTENNRNAQKSKNNASGTTGVSWSNQAGKWMSQIMVDYRHYHLGLFDNLEDAVAARKAAEIRFGFHPGHDREAADYQKMTNPADDGRVRTGASARQSGIPGIYWNKTAKVWQTYYRLNGKSKTAGTHHTVEAALKALVKAKRAAGII